MTTNARTKTSKPTSRPAAKVKSAAKINTLGAINTKKIAGIKGYGLLRLGNKSTLELRDRLAMPRQMFCRVVNVSERTIADAETGCQWPLILTH